MQQEEICPTCGALMRKYWHTLTPGLISALYKFAQAVGKKGKNEVHLLEDMTGNLELTHHEWNNFTRLRFFALVAKSCNPDGTHKNGFWLLTRRGSQFLKGKEEVSLRVQTYRNHVVNHDDYKVSCRYFFNKMPWFETKFEYEIADGDVFIPVAKQEKLI